MKIEFKHVATIGDLKKVFEKAEIPDDAKITVHYNYDLTSSEDTKVVRDTIAKSQGKLQFAHMTQLWSPFLFLLSPGIDSCIYPQNSRHLLRLRVVHKQRLDRTHRGVFERSS